MLIDRRAFLRSLGLVGASSIVGCKGAPMEKMYAYLTPPEDIVPGVATWYATVCRACTAGCGVLVRTREARPIKLEGNPSHPVSGGALCARGQAFIQQLYGRQRARTPLVRKQGDLVPASWSEAGRLVADRLGEARSVALISGLESGSLDDVWKEFASGFEDARRVVHEPLALASMARACELVYGFREVPRVCLEGADRVVSFGASFLDSWLSPVELSRQWAEGHAIAGGRSLRMEYVGPRRDLTAVSADAHHRVASGRIASLVIAVAHGLVGKRAPGMQRMLGAKPDLDEAERHLVDGIVTRLDDARRGLVLFGGPEVTGTDATRAHVAALVANHALGSAGHGLRFGQDHALSRVSPPRDVQALVDEAAAGEIDVLMVHGANPAYSLPGALRVGEGLDRAPFVVCLAHETDETTQHADVVLPVHHPLESWGDYEVARGVYGVMQPVRRRLFDTRHAGDTFLKLASASGKAPHLGVATFKDYVVRRWARTVGAPMDEHDDRWESTLVQGGVFLESKPGPAPEPRWSGEDPGSAGDSPGTGDLALLVHATALLHDGRGGNLDWLMEVPDTVTQTAWEVPLEVSADVAAREGLSDGDRAEISSASGKATCAVLVDEDLVPGTVALGMGGGRSHVRERMDTANVMSLVEPRWDSSGDLATVGTRVSIRRVGGGVLTSVMGEEDAGGRDLYMAMSEKDHAAGRFPVFTMHGETWPDEHGHVHGKPVLMPHQEVPGERPPDNVTELQPHPEHRWGLVVDLDRCTGCGACAVACYAENNIHVVGKEQVDRGRELSWLRIERQRYGEKVRFMPVMCQQCDNAPCETVCPVFAAYHTPDGINAQIYNRCIGTRYCANNCPYKVRRFNWLRFPREEIARQQLNPDVTVRSRGVMEKCNFCLQRIREVTNRAKVEHRPVRDGEIQPACVQTCPTGALSFGDFLDRDGEMSILARDPRGYRILDHILNTRPGVVYLRRVDGED